MHLTADAALLTAIIAAMVYFFFTEKLPVEITAFIGLVVLTLAGYVTPTQAFAGFASPAVITLISIFFVTAGLQATGVADVMGERVYRIVGPGETRLVAAVMLAGGCVSAFMPNVAATAVLLPPVASIARRARVSPSRLLLPLAFGTILGGTVTMVGTAPNIVAAELLADRGLERFTLFDFTPVGIVLLLAGTLFMVTIGRRLLPARLPPAEPAGRDLVQVYRLQEAMFSIRIPHRSRLEGLSLREARLGAALGVQVLGILRRGQRTLAPEPDVRLRGGDVLHVEGSLADIRELLWMQGITIPESRPGGLRGAAGAVSGLQVRLGGGSSLAGATPRDLRFRERFGAVVAGIRRSSAFVPGRLSQEPLHVGDELFLVGPGARLEEIALQRDFEVLRMGSEVLEAMEGQLFVLEVPVDSPLAGSTLEDSRLGELMGLTVVGVVRGSATFLVSSAAERIEGGDRLLVTGDPDRLQSLRHLERVELTQEIARLPVESDDVGLVEVTLAPRTRASGRTLTDMHFREKYRLQVLAIWRGGRPIHAGVARLPLRLGDALLVQGAWSHIRRLAEDTDFVVLSAAARRPRRLGKAPFAVAGLLMMVGFVITGFQPIEVATFAAATLILASRAVTIEEAYRAVDWRSVFLVAAILPFGVALETSGTAALASQLVMSLAGPLGPYALLAGFAVLSSLLSQCLDGAPAVVLLTPVALRAAVDLGISPYPVVMVIALAASAAFLLPFSHKASLLVMGAGGYRAGDYLRVGAPLTLLFLVIVVLLVPVFFALR